MRFLGRLGLALLAAMALTALAGASAASAETTLCKANQSPCAPENALGVGTVFKAVTSSVELGSTGGGNPFTGTCTSSTLEATMETATTPKGKITGLTWNGCNYPTTTTSKGALQFHHDVEGNAKAVVTGVVIEIRETPAGICIYGGTIGNLKLTGGSPALLDVNTAFIKQAGSSFFCPNELMWINQYQVTQPKPLYASKGL
jgi:hypothetical protein